MPISVGMTTAESALEDWASTVFGKTARTAIAVLGLITASLTLMLTTMLDERSWLLVLAGVALAATATRAARRPSLLRLTSVTANVIMIPLLFGIG